MLSNELARRRLEAQFQLSRVLADATTLEGAASRVLEILGKGLDCGVAEMWVLDPDIAALKLVASWSAARGETELTASGQTFRRGEGLPGTVLATGKPSWIRDVTVDPGFKRPEEARRLGLHTAIAFPILFAGEVTGVIEFFDARDREPDAALLETFADVGSQLGVFLERVVMSDLVRRQQRELLQLSTPVLRVGNGVLLAPMIGALDSARAAHAMDQIVTSVESTGARVVLVDVTGVPHLETAITQFLIDTIRATRLVGAKVVLTGVRPALAMTLVHLGVRLDEVTTAGTLADGLRLAMESARRS